MSITVGKRKTLIPAKVIKNIDNEDAPFHNVFEKKVKRQGMIGENICTSVLHFNVE